MMKKLLVFLIAFAFAFGFVHAEITVNGDSTQNVLVGDVETPVYAVEISWTGLVYDWGYLADIGERGWKIHPTCDSIYVDTSSKFDDYVSNYNGLYSNDTCTTNASFNGNNYYYYINKNAKSNINIIDLSTGGALTPSIAFAANSSYNYTTMSYKYEGVDGSVHTFSGGQLPSEARICGAGDEDPNTGAIICDAKYKNTYIVYPTLGIDTTKTVTTPTEGATIGTITLTFATK